jgi:hypothetical protein
MSLQKLPRKNAHLARGVDVAAIFGRRHLFLVLGSWFLVLRSCSFIYESSYLITSNFSTPC